MYRAISAFNLSNHLNARNSSCMKILEKENSFESILIATMYLNHSTSRLIQIKTLLVLSLAASKYLIFVTIIMFNHSEKNVLTFTC